MTTRALARLDQFLRPLAVRLPAGLAIRLYSSGRARFLAALARERPALRPVPPELERRLWGLRFRSPIFNAAGMWKTGDGCELAVHQGAGAFLAGTTTAKARPGNRRHGVHLPFAPYPRSGAASNFLGLPNPGHAAVAARLQKLRGARPDDFPVGASVAVVAAGADSAETEDERLEKLIEGMRFYAEAGVDFLELNESCPNTEDAGAADGDVFSDLERRLERVHEGFLGKRQRALPVVVKFSCDTAPEQLPRLLGLLLTCGFDGVNFGNTSTAYGAHRPAIARAERRIYDHFTTRFGGGLSGRPLKDPSLRLAREAVRHLAERSPEREFHVVRTGGVEDVGDLRASDEAGVALNQWYTGYFEAFAGVGHDVYARLYQQFI